MEPLLNVAPPISNHPDLIFCRLKGDRVLMGDRSLLQAEYPGDVRYNACSTGKYFIHNLKFTDEKLLKEARDMGLIPVDVKQGYAKCSIVVVDEDSIITYDRGIAAACSEAGLDVCLVSPGHVKLDGYPTGFIGGASGRVGDEVIFNGDLSAHPDFEKIKSFIEGKGLGLRFFAQWSLEDIGSIV